MYEGKTDIQTDIPVYCLSLAYAVPGIKHEASFENFDLKKKFTKCKSKKEIGYR